ncbi:MAG: hypothetical protein EBU84_16305 [Actinobacteria bacterium]|nr:hypothetical protein [Actinomycetota bacterium]
MPLPTRASLLFLLPLLLGGCVTAGALDTRVEPLPLKVGALRDNSVELGIPLTYEQRASGGWRSPVELRIRVLLTSPADVPLPLEPNGVTGGVRVRW